MSDTEFLKQQAADAAAELVRDGDVVGLGTGSTAAYAVRRLAARVRAGLRITGVPTSVATEDLARSLGIPLLGLNDVAAIDITLDGADEVDPAFNLIKGGGGALTREKLVARATRRNVIMVDAGKCVQRLGVAYALPVEVVPFGWRHTLARLEALGCTATLRRRDGTPLLTDNGGHVIDCRFGGIEQPAALDAAIKVLPGVVECGIFAGLTHTLIVGHAPGHVETASVMRES